MDSSSSEGAAQSEAMESRGGLDNSHKRARVGLRLQVALPLLIIGLIISILIGLYVGYQPLDFAALKTDPIARAVFFRLRLPRVLMAGLVGASLAMVGAALQALFRNPLADPYTLGVSGGRLSGGERRDCFRTRAEPGRGAVYFYRGVCRSGHICLAGLPAGADGWRHDAPGALLLAGVVLNLSASAGVLVIQYLSAYGRALQILRWLIGSLDVVGFDLIWKMLVFLIPGWLVLFAHARDLASVGNG